MTTDLPSYLLRADALLCAMIEQQRRKVLKIARSINPKMTEDDILDPHSFPEVSTNPQFAFEDGILAGLVAAQVALHREGRDFLRSGKPGAKGPTR
ncbi:hypothetical protein HZA57_04360 [Candidatus Poribacteria bacterium]|nr:hypothetical protein [Candidatus Poribacteria bacterium]